MRGEEIAQDQLNKAGLSRMLSIWLALWSVLETPILELRIIEGSQCVP
jgi:hypothetical protein